MKEAVIVSCARSAIGSFGGTLKDVPVVQLGGLAIKEAIKRAGIRPSRIKDKDVAPDIFAGKIVNKSALDSARAKLTYNGNQSASKNRLINIDFDITGSCDHQPCQKGKK